MNFDLSFDPEFASELAEDVQRWAREAGFQQVGICDTDVSHEQSRPQHWLQKGYQGSMNWIEDRSALRLQPQQLVEGAQRVISFRRDYLPPDTEPVKVLKSPNSAYISRYALGRDYHKLIRKRLAAIATRLENKVRDRYPEYVFSQRAFVDSAPVLERPLAAKAGLGWVGKHTLLIHPQAGSWFFLGEIYTNVPLPITEALQDDRCGDCEACLKVCPTDAFPAPYQLDARRCISYLTIENQGPIPEPFRQAIGNRVYGCDDCQLICPWNKYARMSQEPDFAPRHSLDKVTLLKLFHWDEDSFLANTAGSPIRRIGYQNWQRNLAVGLGNAERDPLVLQALSERLDQSTPLVREHVQWAMAQQSSEGRRRRKRKIRHDA